MYDSLIPKEMDADIFSFLDGGYGAFYDFAGGVVAAHGVEGYGGLEFHVCLPF